MGINKYAFYGAVSMNVSLFNNGGVLNVNNIKYKDGNNQSDLIISFHYYLIKLRNTYLCHRDTLIRKNGMFFIMKDDGNKYIVTDNGLIISPCFDSKDLDSFLALIAFFDGYINNNLAKINDFLNEQFPKNIFNECQIKNNGIDDEVLSHQTKLMKSING